LRSRQIRNALQAHEARAVPHGAVDPRLQRRVKGDPLLAVVKRRIGDLARDDNQRLVIRQAGQAKEVYHGALLFGVV
jgi:hypothetical protein